MKENIKRNLKEDLKNLLLTRESGVRHIVMFGITFLVMAWMYVAMALLQHDWGWILPLFTNAHTAREIAAAWCYLILFFVSCGLMAIVVYWNAHLWMVRCLLMSLYSLIGAIPLVNLLIPAEHRSSLVGEIGGLTAPTVIDETLLSTNTDDGTETWSVTTDRYSGIPFIVALPLGIILTVLKSIFRCAMYLIAAIGIPVCSPIVFILGLWGTSEALNVNVPITTIVCTIVFLLMMCLFVVHPILCFIFRKNIIRVDTLPI